MTHETEGPDDEQSTDKTEMQAKFAEALNLELDAIGFRHPRNVPERWLTLWDMGVHRHIAS